MLFYFKSPRQDSLGTLEDGDDASANSQTQGFVARSAKMSTPRQNPRHGEFGTAIGASLALDPLIVLDTKGVLQSVV